MRPGNISSKAIDGLETTGVAVAETSNGRLAHQTVANSVQSMPSVKPALSGLMD